MADAADHDPLSFLGRSMPGWVERRGLLIEPGGARPYRDDEWRGALVVVELGVLELECANGGRRRFRRGDVLFLAGLPLVALRNPGPSPTLLVAVMRTGPRPDRAGRRRGRR